jgi:hypothetical protein
VPGSVLRPRYLPLSTTEVVPGADQRCGGSIHLVLLLQTALSSQPGSIGRRRAACRILSDRRESYFGLAFRVGAFRPQAGLVGQAPRLAACRTVVTSRCGAFSSIGGKPLWHLC